MHLLVPNDKLNFKDKERSGKNKNQKNNERWWGSSDTVKKKKKIERFSIIGGIVGRGMHFGKWLLK